MLSSKYHAKYLGFSFELLAVAFLSLLCFHVGPSSWIQWLQQLTYNNYYKQITITTKGLKAGQGKVFPPMELRTKVVYCNLHMAPKEAERGGRDMVPLLLLRYICMFSKTTKEKQTRAFSMNFSLTNFISVS